MPNEGESLSDATVQERIRNLSDPDPNVRQMAAEGLGQIIDARSVGPLCATLLNKNEESFVRVAAAYSLGIIGFEQAIPALRIAAQDRDSTLRETATLALGYLRDPGVFEAQCAKLQDVKSGDRMSAIAFLGRIGDPRALDPLIALLRDTAEPYEVCKRVVESLGRFGNVAVPPLTAALQHASPKVRARVVDALGMTRDQTAVAPLFAVLAVSDDNSGVRDEARWALRRIHKAPLPLLYAALEHDEIAVRSSAAEMLGRIGEAEALEALSESLRHADWRDRHNAAAALGEIGDVRAVDPLCALLTDDNWQVREAVSRALGKMGVAADRLNS